MADSKTPTVKRMRVVAISASRSGTLGIYTALKSLGYTPMHMAEVLFVQGDDQQLLRVAKAIEAEHHHGVVPALDLDEFLHGYDALVEVGSLFPLTTLERYLPDPDVKWILTERDPASWVRSVDETIADVYRATSTIEARVLAVFDPWLWFMQRWLLAWFAKWAGKKPGEPGWVEGMKSGYVAYNKLIKKRVPSDRLLTLRLEDGFGWDEICKFLHHPVPDEEYPRINDKAGFKFLIDTLVADHKRKAAKRMMAVLTPVVGIAVYFYCFY